MDKLKRLAAFVLLLLSAAACKDDGPVAPPVPEPASGLALLDCTVTVAGGTMKCTSLAPGVGDADGLIIGGQGTRVFLQAENHSHDPGNDRYAIDVTVQNLIPQALGTTDGVTKHPDAVRVFFAQEPTASDGSGLPVSVFNHHGTDIFLTADQKYFKYDQIIHTNQTSSAVNWQFTVADGLQSFNFKVYVAAQVQFPHGWVGVSPPADSMTAGGTRALAGTVVNAAGDPIPGQTITWGTSDAGIATVDASGLVTGVAPGTATITATSGVRTGSATIAVCPALALGEVYVADMPAGESLCLSGGAQYTVVPVNTGTLGSIALQVTGAGIIPPTEPPAPALFPGGARLAAGPQPDYEFERRLRQMERRAFPTRDPNGAAVDARTRPRLAITPGTPAVGALMSLNVETDDACSTSDTRTGRVMAVGTHVIVMADTTNPSGGLTAAQYAAIADSFDSRIHPVVTGAFGTPSDRDNNQRVIAFYTRAVNELTPPASGAYVGGFFFSRDLRSAADCPTSNVGEMFYMLAADPAGAVNGNQRSVDFILNVTFGTLAHEYQHLVNASRRMLVNTPWNGQLEETWLDEGLSHVAEELMFYSAAGVAPRDNLDSLDIFDEGVVQDAFFSYADDNYARLRQWLLSPHTSGPFQPGDDDLATRGAAWAFLRYAADRRGGTESAFWSSLVNTGNRGLANLQAVLGADPLPWFRDFGAAMYADDLAPGATPQAVYTHPSWNFRSVYAALGYDPGISYPLAPRDPANGVADGFALSNGGAAAYLRMRVANNAFAGVTVRSGGATPPSTVRLAVIRRQ